MQPKLGGAFNPPSAILRGLAKLKMGSHNGRGWVPAASSLIKGPKLKALMHIATSNDIMAFQETHGNIAQLIDVTKPIRNDFSCSGVLLSMMM